ncbi:MAG: hypothetical protein ABIL91_07590 [candidate division WOR-3 bacterium]
MAKEDEKAIIYEKVGEVFCSPPSLEYKKANCMEKASFVCHHCSSPLCQNCVVLVPDDQFPVFMETTVTSPLAFYATILSKVIVAALLFPIIYLLSQLIVLPKIPSNYISLDYYSLIVKLPLSNPLNISLNFVILISVALIISALGDISYVYVKVEEKPDGRRELKKFHRANLSAAHCQYCYEKYHKRTTIKAISTIVSIVATLLVLMMIFIGYLNGFIELTVPIIILMVSGLLRKILGTLQPVKIETVTV